MAKVSSVAVFRNMLMQDFGSHWLGNNAYDGWFGTLKNKTMNGITDFSFNDFGRLPLVGQHGPFAGMMNDALTVAKAAMHKPVSTGTLVNGEIQLKAAHDHWRGGSGNDSVNSGHGNDVVAAGAGNDRVFGGTGNDLIFGEAGNDTLIGAAGNDTIFGGEGRDIIRGWSGDDFIFGGSGNDGLYGAEGNDTIFGGAGFDYICGGSGHDELYGGIGKDTFAFRGQEIGSHTVIKDFEVLHDRQGIKASVAGGDLDIDMIKAYDKGLMIEFAGDRAVFYEGVWDAAALYNSMFLFDL